MLNNLEFDRLLRNVTNITTHVLKKFSIFRDKFVAESTLVTCHIRLLKIEICKKKLRQYKGGHYYGEYFPNVQKSSSLQVLNKGMYNYSEIKFTVISNLVCDMTRRLQRYRLRNCRFTDPEPDGVIDGAEHKPGQKPDVSYTL